MKMTGPLRVLGGGPAFARARQLHPGKPTISPRSIDLFLVPRSDTRQAFNEPQSNPSLNGYAACRPIEIQAHADRIVIRQDGAIVGEHRSCFGRGETIYDPWHYVLARKPGALRNGAAHAAKAARLG
jgi:hypothetical protein